MEKLDIRLIFAILNGEVTKVINRLLQKCLTEAGFNITPEQWIVLTELSEKDGRKQQELCDATFRDKPAMSRLIDDMEKQRLVVRKGSDSDRRAKFIYLTARGYETKERVQRVMLRALKTALSGLGIDDLRVSQYVLCRVFENTTGKVFPGEHPF